MHGATVPRRSIPIGAPLRSRSARPKTNSSTWLSRRSSRSNAQSPHGNVVASREEDRDGLE
eukprot:4376153-Prymnesium_polylepis.1